jgi:putative hydrolase of the HAD superfamily
MVLNRALLVDLGNVLVRFDHGITLKKLEEATSVPAEELRPHLYGPLVREFDLGRLTPTEYFRAVERSAGLPSVPDEVWIPAWRDIFEPDTAALEALGRVRHGVTRVLVSNTNALHWDGVLRFCDVPDLVDACVLSFEIGAMKPDRAFFDAALARAGVPPRDALFADDQPGYVADARRLGFPAILVSGPGDLARGLARHGLLEPL